MAAVDRFHAPLLKIERAKHHIADLNGQVNAYLMKRPFALFVRQEPELAEAALFIETKESIPANFSLLIGDAIHNLRSAFDILIFGLIGDRVKNPANLYFPFCKSAEALKDTITGREIQIAGKDVVAAIESLEPYPDGKNGLHAIHEMDISDKHRLIVPVAQSAAIKVDELREIAPMFALRVGPDPGASYRFIVKPEDPVIVRLTLTGGRPAHLIPRVYEETRVQPTFAICFPEGSPLQGQIVVKALYDLVIASEHAISVIKQSAK